jgi:pyruvate/2-oxoglutarate dehydrogenase complex dihydrolipoamide acyltransferase (E2) component
VRVTLGVQIEDPAPALKKLRDRHDLAAMADLPWAVEAAQTVSSPPDYNLARCLLSHPAPMRMRCAICAASHMLAARVGQCTVRSCRGCKISRFSIPAQSLPTLLKGTARCRLLTPSEFMAVAERQAAAQLTDSPAAAAEPAATAAPPAANGSTAAANGTTAAAAEVADAARRLRMDPRLAARAQAELRISKPQVWVRHLKPLLGGLTTW